MKKKTKVYIYNPNEGAQHFRKRLCKKIGKNKYKYTVVTKVDPETCFPLLVLAHNYSRIGTDVDTALHDLPDLKDETKAKVVIVVYHIQQKHALPQLMPTSLLTDEKYLKYGCLVDFFYTPEEKIYSCKLNEKAEDNLRGYLKSFCKENNSKQNKGRSKHRSRDNTKDRGQRNVLENIEVPPDQGKVREKTEDHDNVRGSIEIPDRVLENIEVPPDQGKVREKTEDHDNVRGSIEIPDRVRGSPETPDRAKTVHMYNPNATRIGEDFQQRLCEQFMKRYRISYLEDANKTSVSDGPLIVVVHYSSRIGTDIDSALSGLQLLKGRPVALVVFHVQAEHALPIMSPTKSLTDDKYSKFDCMVGFFYTKEDMIYNCTLNNKAGAELKRFLKKWVKKKSIFSGGLPGCTSARGNN